MEDEIKWTPKSAEQMEADEQKSAELLDADPAASAIFQHHCTPPEHCCGFVPAILLDEGLVRPLAWRQPSRIWPDREEACLSFEMTDKGKAVLERIRVIPRDDAVTLENPNGNG